MRAALYARVSTEEQVEGYSLDAQRRAFREFCQSKDWIVVEEYVEEGRSAHTEDLRKRPIFKQAVDAALDHHFDVLVVHKIDRFSRKLKVTLETFDKLHKSGVGFVSISEQMDFSTPTGQVFLAMVGAFSQFYSDNLSHETKKGWAERRAQGLYCGLLPFGTMKGEDGIPSPDTRVIDDTQHLNNHDGLKIAFERAAAGSSDGSIAHTLNGLGFRTAGNQGANPFSKDTVRGMLTNRFYLGELPLRQAGKTIGWTKAAHEPLVSLELWNQVQETRERNRRMPKSQPRAFSVTSFTGLARCWYCAGRYHVGATKGATRYYMCYNRAQRRNDCQARSAILSRLEAQLESYLETFSIPDDYQELILAEHRKLADAYDDQSAKCSELTSRLERTKKLFMWGDIPEHDYVEQKRSIEAELASLRPKDEQADMLTNLAAFLRSLPEAWRHANSDQRNRLLRELLDEVWIQDDRIIGVKPRIELEPFFKLSFDDWLRQQQFALAGSKPLRVASSLFSSSQSSKFSRKNGSYS
jgi:site-specific DNA recombinase